MRGKKALEHGPRRGGEPGSPWAATDGWRANIAARETFTFRAGEDELAAEVYHVGNEIRLTLPDGVTANLPRDVPPGWRIERSGRSVFAFSRGTQFRLERIVAVEQAATQSGATGNLNAPMPGRIVSVDVAPGDRVIAGQTVVVLEAMKMEHAIKAPGDGVVAELFHKAGDQVAEGVELLRLDPVEN